MKTYRGPLFACVALAIVSVASSSAHAQHSRDAEARSRFEAGVQLLQTQRYADAATEFERSLALRESPVAEYNLAMAYRGMGKHRRAVEVLTRFCTLARNADELRDAQELLRESAAAVIHVNLRVVGGASDVRVDGGVVENANTLSLDLDPGEHVFEARRTGYEPTVRRMWFEPGARREVVLDTIAHPRRGEIVVDPVDLRASVRVDGQLRGTGRVSLDVAPGTHVIEVRAAGNAVARRTVDVQPGARTMITLAPGASHRGAPWGWAVLGIGLGAAAAVGGIVAWSILGTGAHGTWATTEALDVRR
jgi:hypothetical protein